MPAKEKPALTGTQKKVLREARASLDRAYSTARRTLRAAGFERDDDGGTVCLRPPRGHCRSFVPPRRGIFCARPGCRHAFSKHDVF
jgi:hypothetical protein